MLFVQETNRIYLNSHAMYNQFLSFSIGSQQHILRFRRIFINTDDLNQYKVIQVSVLRSVLQILTEYAWPYSCLLLLQIKYHLCIEDLTCSMSSRFSEFIYLYSICCTQVDAQFEERWNACNVRGWEDEGSGTAQTLVVQPLIVVDDYYSVEELMELDPDRLKQVHVLLNFLSIAVIAFRQRLHATHSNVREFILLRVCLQLIQI